MRQTMIPGRGLLLRAGRGVHLAGGRLDPRPPLGLDPDGGAVVDVADYGRGRVCRVCAFRGADDVGVDGTAGAGEDAAGGAADHAESSPARSWPASTFSCRPCFCSSTSGESVRATCQRRDPQIRWTDRCPMPVLALSILHASSAAMWMPAMAVYGCVMPVFGVILSGAVGAAVILLLTLVLAYLAWGTYRLQMAAWWGTLLLWIAGTLNMITFSQTGLMEMYEKMNMPAAQLDMMRKSGMIETMSRWMPWMGLVGGALWLGYLLYVRRYFVRNVEGVSGDIRPSQEVQG